MNNVLLDRLPTEWNGYKINTDYQIGIQIQLVQEDNDLPDIDKIILITQLLFDDREHPTGKELEECVIWYLTGWNHDNKVKPREEDKIKCVDYDVDQWRIYADFLQIYHIDLSTTYLHWWTFQGLLWNMPFEQSSFYQVIDVRRKKMDKNLSKEGKELFARQKAQYKLEDEREIEKVLTAEQKASMDAFYNMLEK